MVKEGRKQLATGKLRVGRGRAVITLPLLKIGRHPLTVSYLGSATHKKAMAKKVLVVKSR